MKINTPNQLTILRVALIPLLVFTLAYKNFTMDLISVAVFSIAAITDYYDGYLARKYNLVTDFGKIMDPVADKLLVAAALICLVERGDLAAYAVILILAREFAVTALRAVASSHGYVMPADNFGKWKTGLQITAIIMLILSWKIWFLDIYAIGLLILWISIIISLYSGWRYFADYWSYRKQQGMGEFS
ncbi:CDP-diacylglycerol--glycerol-3-phosphate 3-phosphatidyltransferase [Desulfurispirillum indicum]|uniref:CDP-diacylglycerol--glycerol-3-phosphate 3-phosphatidyltransferase n=1 Tax=Desulfurispirillum indicum (strain ATCC BAA-1389 / DSM 22839 / S5) TaxID=653733 RepID=E6W4H7_DESIS|nr:CDP-diacylglycerol--glycerol-3-phosphate 3-phosphatidyltransferase [Desulfurispirillum indicum]ADU67050.1 CDP-diacylglycerol/glycerol-3-phosphate 3-phosphatidyltransferase [Desulfurispirillum indicum S5]UCZ56281.1 CDP-diacylglycerol--glycerol-3-phosphate 3-phosphatidyltransferase [Desulfurispirillum indicum]